VGQYGVSLKGNVANVILCW